MCNSITEFLYTLFCAINADRRTFFNWSFVRVFNYSLLNLFLYLLTVYSIKLWL